MAEFLSDDIRLVQILKRLPVKSLVQISLSTNSWKTIRNKNYGKFSFSGLRDSVVVNGAAYWLQNTDAYSMKGILCFDIDKETLREIMLPTQCCELEFDYSVNLVQRSGELLSLFSFNLSTKILEILVLEKAGEINKVWTKNITLDFKEIDGCWRPVGFRNNDDIVLTRMKASGCMSYDPQRNLATEFVEDSTGLWSDNVFHARYDYHNKVFVRHVTCGKQPIYLDIFEENLGLLDE